MSKNSLTKAGHSTNKKFSLDFLQDYAGTYDYSAKVKKKVNKERHEQ